MFKTISTILIWSADWKRLADWYQETFHMQLDEEIHHPNDTGRRMKLGSTYLWIGQHDKVKGKNPDPHRHMFNITVDSIEEAYNYLLEKKVKILAKPFKAPTFDKYFITFYDPDGNLVQLIGNK